MSAAAETTPPDRSDSIPPAPVSDESDAGLLSLLIIAQYYDLPVNGSHFAKGLAALLALVLIKPWGLGFNWQQISWASLVVDGAVGVHRPAGPPRVLAAFRRSIEKGELDAQAARPALADLSTVEALVEELAHPDERRVLYAIDILESLDKRHLVKPLLLHHDSEKVRVRALLALEAARPELREKWQGAVERLLGDGSVEVRAAAVRPLGTISGDRVTALMRERVGDKDPRVATIAAVTLAASRSLLRQAMNSDTPGLGSSVCFTTSRPLFTSSRAMCAGT